jgi:DNA-binding transcriptional LysR family regulator
MANWFVPEMIGRFHAPAPQVQFDLRQAAGHELAQALATGQVDLVITTPRPHGDEYGWRELIVERLCVVVPRTHHLAKRRRISLSETADEPFIALGSQFALRQLTNELWAAEGISPHVVFEAMETPRSKDCRSRDSASRWCPHCSRTAPNPRRLISADKRARQTRRRFGLTKGRPISPPAERFASFVRHTVSWSGRWGRKTSPTDSATAQHLGPEVSERGEASRGWSQAAVLVPPPGLGCAAGRARQFRRVLVVMCRTR